MVCCNRKISQVSTGLIVVRVESKGSSPGCQRLLVVALFGQYNSQVIMEGGFLGMAENQVIKHFAGAVKPTVLDFHQGQIEIGIKVRGLAVHCLLEVTSGLVGQFAASAP